MNREPILQRAPRLVGLGDLAPSEFPLGALDTAVGTDLENDLVIAHPTVSRRHAILGYHAGGYTIADLQSSNGTFVNGRRIKEPVPIRPGDEISFGAAKFAVVAGASAVRAMRKPRRLDRMIGAAGIVGLALVGFLVTRYVLSLGVRSARQIPAASPSAKPSAAAPVEAVGEGTESPPPAPAMAPAADETDSSSPLWLKHLNEFRAAAGLAPLDSDTRLSDGDRKHATYILKNFGSQMLAGELGAEAHTEDPARPFYTPEGAEAARTSDVAERGEKAARFPIRRGGRSTDGSPPHFIAFSFLARCCTTWGSDTIATSIAALRF